MAPKYLPAVSTIKARSRTRDRSADNAADRTGPNDSSYRILAVYALVEF